MRAREYNKRIEFYTSSAVSDGYGGSTITNSLVATSWAKLISNWGNKNVSRLSDLGVNDPFNTIVVQVRHRNDIDYTIIQYIKYNGIKYVIESINNVDLLDVDIEIIATKA